MKIRTFARGAILALASLVAATGFFALGAAPAQAATSITYPTTYYFGSAYVDGNAYRSAKLGNNGTLKLEAYLGWRYYPGYKVSAHISLQRKIASGHWATVKNGIPVSAKGHAVTSTPKYATAKTSAKIYYRFKSSAYAASSTRGVPSTAYSKTLTLTYQNQKKYTGLRAKAYAIVKPYCPTTAIEIGDPSRSEAGHYRPGSLLISLQAGLSNYRADYAATVFLHECAHERQFVNWGSTDSGWKAMESAMAKRFVNDATPAGIKPTPSASKNGGSFDPVEHAADCAALAIEPAGYLGYGGYCNAKELKYGRALITGHKL